MLQILLNTTKHPIETQLHTVKRTDTSQQKRWVSLGFLFGVPSLGRAESCVTFQRFGKYPFNPTYGTIRFFLKLTLMVRLGN